MKKIPGLLFCCLLSLAASSQTKLIALKSHSGSTDQLHTPGALTLFEAEASDFGLPSQVSLDSVIYVKKSVAIAVTSVGNSGIRRRDTLHSRKLFNKKLPVDSIRKNIHRLIQFESSRDSIRFIGFDQNNTAKKEGSFVPVMQDTTHRRPPLDGMALIITGLILLASSLAGWIAWRWNQKTLQPA